MGQYRIEYWILDERDAHDAGEMLGGGEVRGRGGVAGESFSSKLAAAQDCLQLERQAGRRLRGLTETGEARTARSAVREGEGALGGRRLQCARCLSLVWTLTIGLTGG